MEELRNDRRESSGKDVDLEHELAAVHPVISASISLLSGVQRALTISKTASPSLRSVLCTPGTVRKPNHVRFQLPDSTATKPRGSFKVPLKPVAVASWDMDKIGDDFLKQWTSKYLGRSVQRGENHLDNADHQKDASRDLWGDIHEVRSAAK